MLKDCEIPSVPVVALKILNLVNDPGADVKTVQDAILMDQALAARVLRIANSSYYGLRRNIDTVSEAIIMMGFGTIKNLVLAVSTRQVYKKFGLLEKMLWEHSIGASVAASLIAGEIRFPNVEEASVAGLLHDVGKVAMDNSQPEKFSALMEMVYNEGVTFSMREKAIFGFSHAEAGRFFAQKWGFPEDLCNVIRRHHFDTFNDLLDLENDTKTLCCIVALADALCLRLGVGYREPINDLALTDSKYRKMLDINDKMYAGLIERFNQTYTQEKMSYQI